MKFQYSYMYQTILPWTVTAIDAASASPAAAQLLSRKGVQHKQLEVLPLTLPGPETVWAIRCFLYKYGLMKDMLEGSTMDQAEKAVRAFAGKEGHSPVGLRVEYIPNYIPIAEGISYDRYINKYRVPLDDVCGNGLDSLIGSWDEVMGQLQGELSRMEEYLAQVRQRIASLEAQQAVPLQEKANG